MTSANRPSARPVYILGKWRTAGKKLLSMALDIFMVLSFKVKANQEMLIAQAALRRIEFVCRAKQAEKGMRTLEKFLKK